jgi:hypothetical protein
MNDIEKVIEEAKAEVLPFESWEMLQGEKAPAFAAFCSYRDLGAERNIRRAVEAVESNAKFQANKYSVWRSWAIKFRWKERAADYDRYCEKLKQTEHRKTIEAQGELHRQVTSKMLGIVNKKLDLMKPDELSQGNVTEWVQTAIKADREVVGNAVSNTLPKQGELNFVSDFQGL